MSLFGSKPDPYSAVEIDEEWITSGALSPPDDMEDGIYVKPHKDDGGIRTGMTLLRSLHDPQSTSRGFLRGSENTSPATSFELKYSKEAMGFWFIPGSTDLSNTIRSQLSELYPNSDFEQRPPELLDFRSGRYVSAAELTLDHYTLYPIKHVELEGFESDPLGSIAAEMIGLVSDKIAPAEVAVQVILKPAMKGWTKGVGGDGDIADIAHNLKEPDIRNKWSILHEPIEVEASEVEKKAAKLVQNQSGKQGWWLNIRVIAQSEDPDEAKRRARKTAKMFERYYLSETQQRFVDNPQSGDDLRTCVERAVRREYVSRDMVKARDEVAGIVHIPDGEINTRDLERSTVKGDQGVPPGTPQFSDYDETGYTTEEIPRRSWKRFKSGNWDWPYAIRMESSSDYIDVNTHEYGIEGREYRGESDIYAGAYSRAMIENAASVAQPYWVGLDSNHQTVPILHNESFRHTFVTGQTGAGKSTYILNRLVQHALKGHGFAFVDPGGKDAFELMKMLPANRLNDVVFIDITKSGPEGNNERHIGFNFLETHHNPGETGFHSEVEGIVSDILPLLEADEYQRMKGVAANILRALIQANHADTGYTFTLLDMYYILADDEGRQRYAAFVREEQVDQFLEIFADQLAELDNSDLEPLIRRLQTWIENAMIRPIVSERKSNFSIAKTIDENKILIVKCDTSKDVRQMVSSTITRKIWSVVTARPSRTERFLMGEEDMELPEPLREASAEMGGKGGGTESGEDGTSPKANADAGEIHVEDLDLTEDEIVDHDELVLLEDGRVEAADHAQADYDPYYLVIDELHSVLSEEAQVEDMLAEARKKRLGLVLLTQQTVQLTPEQKSQIMSNCSTLMAFNPGKDGKERRAIADGLDGLKKDDLGVDRYHAWTMITDKEGSVSEPFIVRMLPPYPPRRNLQALQSVIERSLDEYGTKIKTNDEIHGEVPAQFSGGGGGVLAGGDIDLSGLPGGPEATADPDSIEGQQALYEAIHTIQVRSDNVGDFVPIEEVKNEWQRRTGDLGFDSIPSNLIEKNTYIERKRIGGKVMLNLTHGGMEEAGLTFNTGSSASGGKDHHRMVLKYAYYAFTKLGYETWLPEQEGAEEADGMADLPIDPSGAGSFREARRLEDELREELRDAVGTDVAVDLSDGRHVSIEAETSTMRAPEQTLTNLRKALDEGRFCVFACKDEHANDTYSNDTFYWPKRGEKIIYDTYQDGKQIEPDHDSMTFCASVDEDGNRTFYNRKKGYYKIGGEDDVFVLRRRSEAEREDGKTVEIVWEEQDGGEQIVLRDRGVSDGDGGYLQKPQLHVRFDDFETAANPERADVEAYYGYDSEKEEYVVRYDGQTETYETQDELLDKWARIYPPFIPDVQFPREPTEEDFLMIVFPDDDNPDYDKPMIYEKGDVRPLFPDELSMPEVPEATEVEERSDSSEAEGEVGTGPEGETRVGERGAFDQEGEDSSVDELVEIAMKVEGVGRDQAEIAARQVDSMAVPWDIKVAEIKRLAPHWTGSTDGGVPQEDASPSEEQDGSERVQSGHQSESSDVHQDGSQPAHEAQVEPESEGQSEQRRGREQGQEHKQGQDRTANQDLAASSSIDTDETGDHEGEEEGQKGSEPPGPSEGAEPETAQTFRDQLQTGVSEGQETESEEKVEALTDLFEMRGSSAIEAERKAQLRVYGEVRSDPEQKDQGRDQQDDTADEAIALPAADQSTQTADGNEAAEEQSDAQPGGNGSDRSPGEPGRDTPEVTTHETQSKQSGSPAPPAPPAPTDGSSSDTSDEADSSDSDGPESDYNAGSDQSPPTPPVDNQSGGGHGSGSGASSEDTSADGETDSVDDHKPNQEDSQEDKNPWM